MVKKTLLSLAIAATAAGLAGCKTGGDYKVDTGAVTAGSDGATAKSVTPVFSPANSKLPLFSDFIFSNASVTDGTASVGDTQPPVTTALNSVTGASVIAPIDIEFSGELAAASLNSALAVNLIKLRNAEDDSAIDALDLESIAAAVGPTDVVDDAEEQPVPGTDYTVSFLELDDGSTPTLRINLLKPLEPRTKYIVSLTDALASESGVPVSPSAEYSLVTSDLELPSSSLQRVRDAVGEWHKIANGYLTKAAAAAGVSKPEPVLSYAFTTSGASLTLKMAAAPEIYVRALAGKAATAKSLYLAVLNSQLSGDAAAVQQAYVTNIIAPAAASASIALSSTPTASEIAEVEASAAWETTITTAASSSTVVNGITATLHTPSSQTYTPIASAPSTPVALTPAQVFAGTPLAADTVTKYVQGQLELPVGLTAPAMTNAQALASGDPQTISDAVKLSFATDSVWSADDALSPPSDDKVFDPATGQLTTTGVEEVKDEEGNITGYTGGMTNVTYRYPLADFSETEYAPVLVTLPGDYTGLGKANCDALKNSTGLPVIVFIHGITADRTSSLVLGEKAAFEGCFATVALDLPLHGVAPLTSNNNGEDIANAALIFNVEQVNTETPALTPFGSTAAGAGLTNIAERHFNIAQHPSTNARVDMVFGADAESSLGKSGGQFINLANMGRLRDNLRQAVMDNVHLIASLGAMDVDADGSPDFDTDKVYLAGHSLGAIVGTAVTAVVNDPQVQALNTNLPDIKGTVLASPGGALPKMLENSPAFAPTVLGGLNLAQTSSSLQKYDIALMAALDGVDPVSFAAEMGATSNVLMYNIVGGGDCPSFAPYDTDGNPTADVASMVGANCSDGSTQRLPGSIALAFQGKYPPDHVVPNFDYFADAEDNPFTPIMSGLSYELGALGSKVETQIVEVDSAAMPLTGTTSLGALAGLQTTYASDLSSADATGGKFVLPFTQGTHSTFAAADDSSAFTTMVTQMLYFYSTGGSLKANVSGGLKASAE